MACGEIAEIGATRGYENSQIQCPRIYLMLTRKYLWPGFSIHGAGSLHVDSTALVLGNRKFETPTSFCSTYWFSIPGGGLHRNQI